MIRATKGNSMDRWMGREDQKWRDGGMDGWVEGSKDPTG